MTAPQRFRKKPVEIDAIPWDGTAEGATPIIDWILAEGSNAKFFCSHDMGCPGTTQGHVISIRTLEGSMHASPGDMIIRGVQGEFYPCKPDIFAVTYEPVVHAELVDDHYCDITGLRGTLGDTWTCPDCSTVWEAYDAAPIAIKWRRVQ